MSLNVIGFVYSGCQAFDLMYHKSTGKYVLQRDKLRCFFDFFIDQVILLLNYTSFGRKQKPKRMNFCLSKKIHQYVG